MKLQNIHGFSSINDYVKYKLDAYSKEEKNFESLFHFMFDESNNVMAETSDGYRIKRLTYGEMKNKILRAAPSLYSRLHALSPDSIVGLYMANSPEWIIMFWSILACGFRPLLMNARLSDTVLADILRENAVGAVVTDGKCFDTLCVQASEILSQDGEYVERPFGTEVLFMSSGTSSSVKLCAYTGENFYYQICDSANIVRDCSDIKKHYEGELKQLVLLPFYHVFGFIAVYLWFAFFARTFVFPKDLSPDTIRNTVKKHKVTHIFAVPMVWEGVCKAALKKIRQKGEKTYRKFMRVSSLVNKLGRAGDIIARFLLSEVRDNLFGNSICCLITGGSHISCDALRFFNGIGYHLANGYGMTEIGITSVEKSHSKKILNSATIGASFGYTEYSVSPEGVLLVKGKTMASRIIENGEAKVTDFDSWFITNDIVRFDGVRYYVDGRVDDLIIGEDGENINPVIAERTLNSDGVEGVCLFADRDKRPVLLASVPGCFSADAAREIFDRLYSALKNAKLDGAVKRVFLTPDPLLSGNDFKISRRKISDRYSAGDIRVFDYKKIDEHIEEMVMGLEAEIRACFAEVLERTPESIGTSDNFFIDLEGTSLDYFSLLGIMRSRFGMEMPSADNERLATVKDFFEHIRK